ncbi:MAG: response regulator [Sphingomonadaceae bacterium]
MTAKILIVEDEILVAVAAKLMLQSLGHEIVGIAPDLPTALAISDRARPDLALVDLNLRDGLTGPQIGEKLCAEHNVAVLFVTANPRILGNGITGTIGVLTKPTDRDAIEGAVNDALRIRRGDTDAAPPRALKTFSKAA